MKGIKVILVLGVLVALALPAVQSGRQRHRWRSFTDEQLLERVNAAVQAGSFHKRDEALEAASELLRRGNPKVKDAKVIDCLITSAATLLSGAGTWTDSNEARPVYDTAKRFDDRTIVDALVRRVMSNEANRLRVLFLSVKLGIAGSEDRLNEVLDRHGDKKMAEDFLNAGSAKLYEGGKAWANKHGYSIGTGMGSHRVSWGRF
jgi:hypothetical protein